jgi:hypothetical protein
MSARKTIFSLCRKYRYTLWREFGADYLFDGGNRMREGFAQFIGLNPSTADEVVDDPTVRRCIRFSKDWGFGALCMTNIFAYRATLPKDMMAVHEPIGEDNDEHLYNLAKNAGIVICAWGKDGNYKERGKFVIARLWEVAEEKLHHLGLNGDGTPKHPLYLKASTKPIPFYK